MAFAGPSGTKSFAQGTEGSGSKTGFENLSSDWEDSFGFASDGQGNQKAFSTKKRSDQKIKGGGTSGSKGKGKSMSVSNNHGSKSVAMGEFGSFGNSDFGKAGDAWEDSWQTSQDAHGNFRNKRKKFRKKDKSRTHASGIARGHGIV